MRPPPGSPRRHERPPHPPGRRARARDGGPRWDRRPVPSADAGGCPARRRGRRGRRGADRGPAVRGIGRSCGGCRRCPCAGSSHACRAAPRARRTRHWRARSARLPMGIRGTTTTRRPLRSSAMPFRRPGFRRPWLTRTRAFAGVIWTRTGSRKPPQNARRCGRFPIARPGWPSGRCRNCPSLRVFSTRTPVRRRLPLAGKMEVGPWGTGRTGSIQHKDGGRPGESFPASLRRLRILSRCPFWLIC